MLCEEARIECPEPLFDVRLCIVVRKRRLCEHEYLFGREAPAEHVVQIEVVKLVGTDYILGYLTDFAVLCGQKLGAYGSCKHVVQRGGEFFIARFCDVFYEVTHECLRHGGVNAVH